MQQRRTRQRRKQVGAEEMTLAEAAAVSAMDVSVEHLPAYDTSDADA